MTRKAMPLQQAFSVETAIIESRRAINPDHVPRYRRRASAPDLHKRANHSSALSLAQAGRRICLTG